MLAYEKKAPSLGGLVCVEAVGSGCYPESNAASARIRTEEQCLSAQQSGEAPEASQSVMRGH